MPEIILKIHEIILQPDNAIIRRNGQIKLIPGLNTIDISELDPKLESKSLQLIISGENIVIHNVQFSTQTIEKKDAIEELRTEQKKNNMIIEQKKFKQIDIEFWIEQYNTIQRLLAEKFPEGYTTAKVPLTAYSDFDEYIDTELTKYLKEKELLLSLIKEVENKNKIIQKNLSDISNEKQEQKRGHLTLSLESGTDQVVDIQLEYLLPAGKWNMFYELQLKDETYILTKWVEITNTSAETWNDVHLTLTDKIRSEISIEPPELVYMEPDKGIESDFLIPVQSIHLPTKVSIKNDSKPYTFEIGKEEITSARYLYYWNAADFAEIVEILIISLKNYLYPAAIKIFQGGVFLDSIDHMEFIPPGDEIGIPLRTAKTIKTSKRGIQKEVKQTGVIKKQTEVLYDYILTISNPFDQAIDIVVYEQIPEPINLDKKGDAPMFIDYKAISSLPYKVFDNGRVRWDLAIPPRAQKEIDFKIKLVKGE